MNLASSRRRRTAPLAVIAGLLGSAMLTLGATGTFSALTAQVNNTMNTAGSGTIVMEETDSSGTQSNRCVSTSGTSNVYGCTTFNKFGGSQTMRPGDSVSSPAYPSMSIRIYNTGTLDASGFTVKPLNCTSTGPSSSGGNICTKLRLALTCTVTNNGTAGSAVSVYDGTLANSSLTQIANTTVDLKTGKACTPPKTTSGGTSYTTFAFTVTLDSSADASYMGETAAQGIDWQFAA